MTTITREQLIGRAQARLELMQAAAREFHESPSVQMDLELARIALATLEAEPVAWIVHARTGDQLTTDGNYVANAEGILGLHSTPLYTAPPAPVANSYPLLEFVKEYIDSWGLGMAGDSGLLASAKQAIADSAIQQPVPVVPATLPCSVELKPGLIIGKGCKTETLLTALQRRADYYAEIDAMTPEERAEHDANIEAFKAMLPQPDIEMLSSALRNAPLAPSDSQGRPRSPVVPEAKCDDDGSVTSDFDHGWNACRSAMLQAGNSPVIGIDLAAGPDRTVEARYYSPPGYVMVPIEPTEDMVIAGFESRPDKDFSEPEVWDEYQEMSGCQQAAHRAKLCWDAMISAAPQQKVKSALEHGMQHYAGAMQKLAEGGD